MCPLCLAAENAALRSIIDDLTAGEIHTCHDHCQRTACILRRENTALRSRLADIESQNRVMWDVANDREARLAEAKADMARLLRDGIVNAPCPTPGQWRQLQDFAKGYLAGADSAVQGGQ